MLICGILVKMTGEDKDPRGLFGVLMYYDSHCDINKQSVMAEGFYRIYSFRLLYFILYSRASVCSIVNMLNKKINPSEFTLRT